MPIEAKNCPNNWIYTNNPYLDRRRTFLVEQEWPIAPKKHEPRQEFHRLANNVILPMLDERETAWLLLGQMFAERSDAPLHRLFLTIFTVEELRVFLEQQYPMEAPALLDRGSSSEIAWSAVRSLRMHGRIDEELFMRLIELRPHRRAEIAEVEVQTASRSATGRSERLVAGRRLLAWSFLALLPLYVIGSYGWFLLSPRPSIDVVIACVIKCSGCPGLVRGWIVLDSGESFVARIRDGNELRFECLPLGTKVAVWLELHDGQAQIRYYSHEIRLAGDMVAVPFSEFEESQAPAFLFPPKEQGAKVTAVAFPYGSGFELPPPIGENVCAPEGPINPSDHSAPKEHVVFQTTTKRSGRRQSPPPIEVPRDHNILAPPLVTQVSSPLPDGVPNSIPEAEKKSLPPPPEQPSPQPKPTERAPTMNRAKLARSLVVQFYVGDAEDASTENEATLALGSNIWTLFDASPSRLPLQPNRWVRFEFDVDGLTWGNLTEGELQIKLNARTTRHIDSWLLGGLIIQIDGIVVYNHPKINRWFDAESPKWSTKLELP